MLLTPNGSEGSLFLVVPSKLLLTLPAVRPGRAGVTHPGASHPLLAFPLGGADIAPGCLRFSESQSQMIV